MRYWSIFGILVLLTGAGLVVYSRSLPLYTNPAEVDKLDKESDDVLELDSKSLETRTQQWYQRLSALETPRKHLSDLGRGLIAAGAGLLAAVSFWGSYHHWEYKRNLGRLLRIFVYLWLLRIPLSFWYYGLRLQRGDYPWWSDSIAIPIFSECFIWIVGAGISSLLLRLLQTGRVLPEVVRPVLPRTAWGWIRTVLLVLWMALLVLILYLGVRYGNEGGAFTSVLALVILYVLLCSRRASLPKVGDIHAMDEPRPE